MRASTSDALDAPPQRQTVNLSATGVRGIRTVLLLRLENLCTRANLHGQVRLKMVWRVRNVLTTDKAKIASLKNGLEF